MIPVTQLQGGEDEEEPGRQLDQEGGKSVFEYKLHVKMNVDQGLFRELDATSIMSMIAGLTCQSLENGVSG